MDEKKQGLPTSFPILSLNLSRHTSILSESSTFPHLIETSDLDEFTPFKQKVTIKANLNVLAQDLMCMNLGKYFCLNDIFRRIHKHNECIR